MKYTSSMRILSILNFFGYNFRHLFKNFATFNREIFTDKVYPEYKF